MPHDDDLQNEFNILFNQICAEHGQNEAFLAAHAHIVIRGVDLYIDANFKDRAPSLKAAVRASVHQTIGVMLMGACDKLGISSEKMMQASRALQRCEVTMYELASATQAERHIEDAVDAVQDIINKSKRC